MDSTTPTTENHSSNTRKRTGSREEMLGGLVVFGIILLFAVVVGVIGFAVYRTVNERVDSRASIVSLNDTIAMEEVTVEQLMKEVPEESVESETSAVDMSVEILVLNGGGPKGSAGATATILKGALFSSTIVSNALGDYQGVTVYYQSEKEKATAEKIVEALQTKYPKAKSQQAGSIAETKKSPIVVIVGA